MTRLSDALSRARDADPGAGSGTPPYPREMVIASDETVVIAPWTLDEGEDDPAPAHSPLPRARAEAVQAFDRARHDDEDRLDAETAPGSRRRWLAAFFVTALVAAAAAYALAARGNAAAASQEVAVVRGALHQIVAARGKVEPGTEIGVTAKMIGRIKALHVREGDIVRQGQLLAEMDDDDLRAQHAQAVAMLNEARARLAEVLAGAREQEREAALARLSEARSIRDEAQATLTRQQTLAAEGLISQSQLDESVLNARVAAAQLRSAEEHVSLVEAGARDEARAIARAQVARAAADVRYASALLANAQVLAPVDARVLRVYMHPGEVIVLQRPQPIVLLGEGRNTFVRAEVDESDLNKVSVGQEAVIRSDAYPNREFRGRVVQLAPSVGRKLLRSDDPAEMLDTRVLETRIDLGPDAPLALGLTVDVEIQVVNARDVPVVPLRAVQWDGGVARVEVRSGETTETRHITTGTRDDVRIEVREGLREGETVLVRR